MALHSELYFTHFFCMQTKVFVSLSAVKMCTCFYTTNTYYLHVSIEQCTIA